MVDSKPNVLKKAPAPSSALGGGMSSRPSGDRDAAPALTGLRLPERPSAAAAAPAPVPVPAAARLAKPAEVALDDGERAIAEELQMLEKWAQGNRRDAEKDRARFWALKLPAIICAAAISGLEGFGMHTAVSFLGVISAICVACDALMPRGLLHNVHRRAFNELRFVAQTLKKSWDIAKYETTADSPERKAAIVAALKLSQSECVRINDYITAAEASLGEPRR